MSNEEEQTGLKMEKELKTSDKMESVEDSQNPTHNKPDGPDYRGEAGISIGFRDEPKTTAKKTCCCDECGKTFRSASTFRRHQRVHSRERPHSCDECGMSFKWLHSLKRHQLIHSGEKLFRCHLRQKSFHDDSFKHYKNPSTCD